MPERRPLLSHDTRRADRYQTVKLEEPLLAGSKTGILQVSCHARGHETTNAEVGQSVVPTCGVASR
jgi:hypothetical protein